MRNASIAFVLLTLLACGEDASEPDEGGPDAASERDAGEEASDAATEGDAGEEASDAATEGDAGEEADDAASDASSADADIEPAARQVVLSGALTETIDIVVPRASWSKSNDQGSLIHLPGGVGAVQAGFTFTFSGPPEEGETYDQTRSGVSCALTATRASDNATWDAVHGIQGASDQGSCSVTLSAVEQTLDVDALKQFEVHGSVEGTLQPKEGSGADGSVTLRAKF